MGEHTLSVIKQNIRKVQSRINEAARRAGRDPSEISLVAVTKTVPVEKIKEAISAGICVFGENYVQEAKKKIEHIGKDVVKWHMIGHLQTNKAKDATILFDMIETVDRVKLADVLDQKAASRDKTLDVLVQVNLSGEASKSGVRPDEALSLVDFVMNKMNLRFRGLMTIPPYFEDPERTRPYFARLRRLGEEIRSNYPGLKTFELSMGMSGDFEVAIEEGATIVRIGTAIFGPRD